MTNPFRRLVEGLRRRAAARSLARSQASQWFGWPLLTVIEPYQPDVLTRPTFDVWQGRSGSPRSSWEWLGRYESLNQARARHPEARQIRSGIRRMGEGLPDLPRSGDQKEGGTA